MVNESITTLIYAYIKDNKYHEAIKLLNSNLSKCPKSRAGLSLLGYCYFYIQDFLNSSSIWFYLRIYYLVICYEKLVRYFPDVEDYKIYYAQSLFKAGMYNEASRTILQVTSLESKEKVLMLQAQIKYEQEDIIGCKNIVNQLPQDEPDTLVARACIAYKENDYENAKSQFTEAINQLGYQSDLNYNIALCNYKQKQYPNALRGIAEIIEKGVREHPELSVGSNTENIQVRSVGNSKVLKETALIEAFNLKAAIEYQVKNYDAAREALSDMPPRSETELDAVTLHNQALINMDLDPTAGFSKLNFLIENPPGPVETFPNILLLYCKYQCYALAADIMAEYPHLQKSALSQELFEYLDAMVLKDSSPEESFRKWDDLATKHIEQLRKLTKSIQDARIAHDQMALRVALHDYDSALEKYIPVLMAQAKIYWDIENYQMVEKIFQQSGEFCNEHETWKLNIAHIFFMRENKFNEAIKFYEPYVHKRSDNLLDVTAIVLANLCVSYIMTSKNKEAEELMRDIEKEEERVQMEDPEKQCYHLCIVNLVIGTLYCSKGNYEFGISRIIKSLEPYKKNLHADTWFYAKRCLLSMCESMAKNMQVFKDSFFQELLAFFDAAEEHGKTISTDPNESVVDAKPTDIDHVPSTVASEARILKKLVLRLYKDY